MRKLGQKGVAMLMAMVTLLLLGILAGELIYMSGVYSATVFKQRDQLRATLLARSGLRMALLQIRAAKKAKAKAKTLGLGDNNSITDKIWQTPLVLPPPSIPGLDGTDKATLDAFTKSLGLEGNFSTTILGSNDKMSINQLVWLEAGGKTSAADGSTKGTGDQVNTGALDGRGSTDTGLNEDQKKEKMKKNREMFAEIFSDIFEKKRQSDDAFREKYHNLSGAWVVGNLLAWMDPATKEDGDNRGKNEYYSAVQPSPYALKDAPIVSESEYPMIKGFDDVIAKLVGDNFTVLTTTSLNVNKASMLLIGGLIPELSPDALERIEKRRTDATMGGEFKDASDFWTYVNTLGSYDDAKKKFEERGIKILGDETSYRVVVTAESGMARKTWLADVGPMPPKDGTSTSTATSTAQPQPSTPQTGEGANGTSTSTNTNTESSDSESVNIIYLKAD